MFGLKERIEKVEKRIGKSRNQYFSPYTYNYWRRTLEYDYKPETTRTIQQQLEDIRDLLELKYETTPATEKKVKLVKSEPKVISFTQYEGPKANKAPAKKK